MRVDQGRRRFVARLVGTAAALSAVAGAPGIAAANEWADLLGATSVTGPPRIAAMPPYRTQLDGSRYAGSNCGPATLGMTLAAHGRDLENLELRRLTHTYQGTWPGRGGTALQHMARVAEDQGIPSHGLFGEGDTFRAWSVEDVTEQVQRGRMVIPLVRYGLLPGHEASGVRFGHYVVLYGIEGDGFRYHDSAFRPIEEGAARWISRDQLDRAMTPVLVPRQAVAFGA